MKIFYFFFSLILSHASVAENETALLQCREVVTEGKRSLILSADNIDFIISTSQSTCESSFEYQYLKSDNDRYLITSWPTSEELGVNAQRNLYIASPERPDAKYIGSVPVDAEIVGEGRYRRISQEGGSIHETIYFMRDAQIDIEKPSKELVIANTECIYLQGSDSECQRMTGTFENPICVYSHDGKKSLADVSSCSELLNFQ
ncbi:hypothetical protein [Pseudomonas sp. UBA2684]|uniref:hypothetical protein n=1 Tax=Pseudomonas sp. UBA2684 TaxID=1947311 RepID=UPI0025E31F55|nr:hypothetical protein [Pseudomonas sp. UBA2684]|tara:strand:- start:224 stop:832 length:609 start_codon:yes stop_codon:yes gene_type:complete